MKPAYTDGWSASKVAEYLLGDSDFVEWRSPDGQSPEWITAAGQAFVMMDDDDSRWLATWKFVADRGRVTRAELLSEFDAQGDG